MISRLFQLRAWALSQEGEDFVGDDTRLPEGLSWDLSTEFVDIEVEDLREKIEETKTRLLDNKNNLDAYTSQVSEKKDMPAVLSGAVSSGFSGSRAGTNSGGNGNAQGVKPSGVPASGAEGPTTKYNPSGKWARPEITAALSHLGCGDDPWSAEMTRRLRWLETQRDGLQKAADMVAAGKWFWQVFPEFFGKNFWYSESELEEVSRIAEALGVAVPRRHGPGEGHKPCHIIISSRQRLEAAHQDQSPIHQVSASTSSASSSINIKIAELSAAAADPRYHRMAQRRDMGDIMRNYSHDIARIIYMSTSWTPREDDRFGFSSAYPDLARARWWDLKTVPLADSMLDWLAEDRMLGAQVGSSVFVRAQIVENRSTASPLQHPDLSYAEEDQELLMLNQAMGICVCHGGLGRRAVVVVFL